jgi:Tol biopolymer transport system component
MGKNTYVSYLKNGRWSQPAVSTIDTVFGIGEPLFSPDGSKLYFLSRRPPTADAVERERIWYVTRERDRLGEPILIDSVVAEHPTHWQFSMAANGNLYFMSETAEANGGQDIYMSEWNGEAYLEPISLGEAINSEARDLCPFISPDESFLIFARTGADRANRSDLFISFRDTDGNWREAVNMGSVGNSEHNEVCPIITTDGRYLFFLRVSGSENGIYWVSTEILERLRPR